MAAERLQKVLSSAGVASRRQGERLIREGRVLVNGEIVTRLGAKADPLVDEIRVDGKLVRLPERRTYIVINKPKGYVCSLSDPQGRPTVRELLPPSLPRLYHVGRLDCQTEGLLFMTDDGAFAQRVAHPRHGCTKVYLAKVAGVPDAGILAKLRSGVVIDGVRTAPARVELVRSTRRDGNTWLSLTLVEGRSRQVRRMLEAVGHPVSKLKRVQIGSVDDRGLRPGAQRELTAAEIASVMSDARSRAAAGQDRRRGQRREPSDRAPVRLRIRLGRRGGS